MPTTIKNVITPNIGTVTTVYNPTTPGIQSTMIGFVLSNTTASAVTASVTITNNAATTVYLIKNVSIPANNSLDIVSGSKVAVNQGDTVQVVSSATASIDVVISVVEVV